MTWESIGTVNTGDMPHEEDWILLALKLAKSYLVLVCGAPPSGCNLDVMWHDHELGSYPSLGLWSEFAEVNDYFSRCERALDCFNGAVSWGRLKNQHELWVEAEANDAELVG